MGLGGGGVNAGNGQRRQQPASNDGPPPGPTLKVGHGRAGTVEDRPSDAPAVLRQPLFGQTRAFCDHVTLEGESVEALPSEWLDSRLEKNGVTFIRYLSDDLTLEKTYRLQYGRMVIVAYTLRNLAAQERTFRLRITHELCPDYEEVIRRGRETLAFIDDPDAPGVINTHTHMPVTVHSSRPWQALETREDFCALTLVLVFDVTIGPRSEQKFEMKLARGKEPR